MLNQEKLYYVEIHNSGKIIKKSRMHYHKIYSSDFSSRRKIGNIIKKDEKGFMGTGNVFTLDGS